MTTRARAPLNAAPTAARQARSSSPDKKDHYMASKKKVAGLIKLQIQAGAANPAPPIGPALGQHGVNIMERQSSRSLMAWL